MVYLLLHFFLNTYTHFCYTNFTLCQCIGRRGKKTKKFRYNNAHRFVLYPPVSYKREHYRDSHKEFSNNVLSGVIHSFSFYTLLVSTVVELK